jgi:DNA-binding PadR family transcriptional regulator
MFDREKWQKDSVILAIPSRGEDYGYSIIRKVREISGGNLYWIEGMRYPVL